MPEQKIESGRIADGAVLGNKIAPNAVRGNNIVAGTITGNLITDGAISGNSIVSNAIRGNNIVAGTITGNLIADLSVSSNNLTANLNISLRQLTEKANISAIALGGVGTNFYTIHVANNGIYFFDANTTGNVTFNLRANTQNAFDSLLSVGDSASLAIGVRNGTTRYTANLQIDDNAQTLFYVGNTRPTFSSITNQEYNIFSYTVFKTGANAYICLAANSIFGMG